MVVSQFAYSQMQIVNTDVHNKYIYKCNVNITLSS